MCTLFFVNVKLAWGWSKYLSFQLSHNSLVNSLTCWTMPILSSKILRAAGTSRKILFSGQ